MKNSTYYSLMIVIIETQERVQKCSFSAINRILGFQTQAQIDSMHRNEHKNNENTYSHPGENDQPNLRENGRAMGENFENNGE